MKKLAFLFLLFVFLVSTANAQDIIILREGGGGGGSGSVTTVEEGDAQVGGADIIVLDFLANDFIIGETPDTEINISIDYTNGQAAATGVKGFLTGTDWDTFNGKESALTDEASLYSTLSDVTQFLEAGDNATLLDGTNWRLLYINGSGDVIELALGADRTRLESNGASAVPTFVTPREFSKLDLTADTSISEAQIVANRYISNQGDAGEADLTLPAVSYAIQVIFSIEEAQNIEINPPAGEIFDLDGTALDANDCVDSDSTVGSKISCTRLQIASGAWRWSLDTIRGVWVDTGPTD